MTAAPDPAAEAASHRLLVVDDDADFAESLADVLAVHGYVALIARDPGEALELLRREAPPVVMLDIQLGASSGVDLLGELTRQHPQLICVMMTAHVDTRTAIQALRRGAYDYIDKSCDPAEVGAVLQRAFEKHQLQQEHARAAEALRVAKDLAEQASRAKSEFLATVSHELRTPLNAIIGFSELVLSEALGPLGNDKYRSYIQDVHDSGQHLLGIINDILDLSKAEAGRLELDDQVVDVAAATQAVCRLLHHRAKEGGLAFRSCLPPDLPLLRGDERKLKQVLLNLLSNAIKFTPTGGEVELRASIDRDGALRLAISDTGIGIAPEHHLVVFEPFSQIDSSLSRRHAGTGLGLPLVKALMELHGGQVALESRPGHGTTVAALFPPARVLARAAASAA